MQRMFTESEWERITEFANTPGHQREPEQLIPDDQDSTSDSAPAGNGKGDSRLANADD